MGKYLKAAAMLVATICAPSLSHAQETLSFQFPNGAPQDLREKLQNRSVLFQAKADGQNEPHELLAAAITDYNRLLSILYEEARYSGQISITLDGVEASDMSIFETPEEIHDIKVSIQPGPEFRFGDVKIHPAAPNVEITEPPLLNAPARSEDLYNMVQGEIEQWRDAGHALAAVSSQDVIANHEASRLRADISIDPGPKYTFGSLLSSAEDTDVSAERLREVAGLPAAGAYSPQETDKALQRLRRVGAYKSVSFSEKINQDSQTVDISAKLVEQKPRRFGVGAEFISPDGFTLSGFWLHRNLGNSLDSLRLDGRITGIESEARKTDLHLGLRYEHPAFSGPDTLLYFETELDLKQEPLYDSQEVRIGTGIKRQYNRFLTGETGISLDFSQTKDAFGDRRFNNISLPGKFTYDRSDDRLDPKEGYSLRAEITPFFSPFGGTSGVRSFADARGYLSFGESNDTTLALRAQAGTVSNLSIDEISPDHLFYSGGGGTVRGHEFQSLGTTLSNGQKTGGRSFIGLSAEIRQDLFDPFSAAGFVDAGWIGSDIIPQKEDPWHAGIGAGLRYDTPVGPARLDIAFPLKGQSTSDFQIYIGIGQTF